MKTKIFPHPQLERPTHHWADAIHIHYLDADSMH